MLIIQKLIQKLKLVYTISERNRELGCPVDCIDFIDDMNHKQTIECYNANDTSKGLLAIAGELGLAISNKRSLSEPKAILRMHNALKSASNQYLDTLYAVNNLFKNCKLSSSRS